MVECYRKNKWFRACNFEPRYDFSAPDFAGFKSISNLTPELSESFQKKTYVKDVCTACGCCIMREESGK
jgi:hypothetical protein